MNDSTFDNDENIIFKEIDRSAGKINCVKVGIIKKVNDNNSVTVKLENGITINCLLFCMAAASGFIDFEDYKGSDCIVLFNDDDLVRYKTGNNTLKNIDSRKHTLNSGIALSGLFPFGKRPKGTKHFVSFEQLDEIMNDWAEKLQKWSNDLLSSLNSATVLVTAAQAGAMPAAPPVPPVPVGILYNAPLPSGTDLIDITPSKVGGIVHND
jgi:hypothetical protein